VSRVITRGESFVPVSTDGGRVNSIKATYDGDLAEVFVQVHDSTPKATLTFSGVGVATQTVTIGDVVYTWIATLSTGPTVANEVLIGANQAASHANLLAAIQGAAGEATTYGEGTVRNPWVEAWEGVQDKSSLEAFTADTLITLVGAGGTAVVPTTETGTNTSFDVATIPRLAASAVPKQLSNPYSTSLKRFGSVEVPTSEVDDGCIVVLSSSQSIYTAVTYDDIYNGTTAEDRCTIEVDFDSDVQQILTEPILLTDASLVCGYKFDGDLLARQGGTALVDSGTSVWGPSPLNDRTFCYVPILQTLAHAANDDALELTEAMTLHMFVKFVAMPNSVFVSFGDDSEDEVDNLLFSVAASTVGALTWLQENSTGTDSSDTALPLLPLDEWIQITYTRPEAATSVKLYLNGRLADTSGALTAPTGGSTSVLRLAQAEDGTAAPVSFQSFDVFSIEMTAAEVLAHCNRERGI
jgi:hypothetical protein